MHQKRVANNASLLQQDNVSTLRRLCIRKKTFHAKTREERFVTCTVVPGSLESVFQLLHLNRAVFRIVQLCFLCGDRKHFWSCVWIVQGHKKLIRFRHWAAHTHMKNAQVPDCWKLSNQKTNRDSSQSREFWFWTWNTALMPFKFWDSKQKRFARRVCYGWAFAECIIFCCVSFVVRYFPDLFQTIVAV